MAAASVSPCSYLARAVDADPGSGPAFLPSYPTERTGALHNTAFLYDNDVAAIALVACGDPDRAKRIGSAILAALANDRHWHDGRLRNAYLAGPVNSGDVRLSGWWDPKQNKWLEDAYQVGSDSGNMAWTILALLALDQSASDRRYRDGAIVLGRWVAQWRSKRGAGGISGGTFDEEPSPKIERWKSTEHNTDLAAAFEGLAVATHDKKWAHEARVAQNFVYGMWEPACSCFDAGTIEDGLTRNHFLALDAQLFALLALPGAAHRYRAAIRTVQDKLSVNGGLAYSEAKGGMWTEGTEQGALLLALLGQERGADALIQSAGTMRSPDGSYYATNAAELATGLSPDADQSQARQYFHIEHLAPVAWAALLERRYNPFTRLHELP
jgi:hypothetical protein